MARKDCVPGREQALRIERFAEGDHQLLHVNPVSRGLETLPQHSLLEWSRHIHRIVVGDPELLSTHAILEGGIPGCRGKPAKFFRDEDNDSLHLNGVRAGTDVGTDETLSGSRWGAEPLAGGICGRGFRWGCTGPVFPWSMSPQ